MTMYANGADLSDHLHRLGVENDRPVPVTDFDFDAVDPLPQTETSLDQAVKNFGALLDWLWHDHPTSAYKLAALRTLLDPVQGEFRSLAEIAREAGLSRAAVSGWISELRTRFGIAMNFRGSATNENCKLAQLRAVANGTHAARKTKGNPKNLTYNQDRKMNQKEIRQKFRTLDAAVTEIERLSKTQSSAPAQSASPNTAATPIIMVSPQPVQKPPASSPSPRPSPSPPKLADLNQKELLQVLDLANARGDRDLVAQAYAELNERRKPI
jgi:hypothetical protein